MQISEFRRKRRSQKRQTDFAFITGHRGAGKSKLLGHRILESDRCVFFDPEREWKYRGFENLDELDDALQENRWFRFAFWPTDPKAQIDDFVSVVSAKGDLFCAIDEADKAAPLKGISKGLQGLIFRCRHRGISMMFATQRPAAVNPDLRSMAQTHISFRLVHPLDVEACRYAFGEKTDLLPYLPNGHHLYRRF